MVNESGRAHPMDDKYTAYQQNVIKNYYKNRENISIQRAQELVTELYLSEGKKRTKVWEQLESHLSKIGVGPDVIANLRQKDKPELVASLLTKY
jgi:hypothetical protein